MVVVAVLCLLVPTIGSFYPLPAYPVRLFPYMFMAWIIVGAGWLYVVNRRSPGVLNEIEADFERVTELKEEVIEIFEHTHVHPHEHEQAEGQQVLA